MPFDSLKRLLSGLGPPRQGAPTDDSGGDEFAWMIPPRDMHDSAAWDTYWHNQVQRELILSRMAEMLNDSDTVIAAMRDNGLHSVLFVGNGLSAEPPRYIEEGFDVTILDLSSFAMERYQKALAKNHLDGQCVTGDLLDPSVCPGPFDVIVERRTLQLFDDLDRPRALAAVTDRLSPRGLFVTHAHLGAWRPGDPLVHPADAWLRGAAWPDWVPGTALRGRAALICVTTG
jgi:hypothetical protein